MPFWGLVVTSALFFIPTRIAFMKGRRKEGFASSAIMITSLLYHSTTHCAAEFLDKVVVHTISYHYGIRTLTTWMRTPTLPLTRALGLQGLTAVIYYRKSRTTRGKESSWWHMVVHGCGLASSILLVLLPATGPAAADPDSRGAITTDGNKEKAGHRLDT